MIVCRPKYLVFRPPILYRFNYKFNCKFVQQKRSSYVCDEIENEKQSPTLTLQTKPNYNYAKNFPLLSGSYNVYSIFAGTITQ